MDKRRIISLFLSLAVVFALASPAVFAADDGKAETEYLFFDSFEDGLSKWNSYETAAKTYISDERATDGSKCAVAEDASETKGAGFRTKNIPITPGNAYEIYVDMYRIEGSGGELYVEFWNKSGKRIGVSVKSGAVTGEWRTTTSSAAAPADAAYLTVLLYSGGSPVGIVAYDNVRVVDVSKQIVAEEFDLKVKDHPRLYFTKDETSAFIKNASDTAVTYNGNSMRVYRDRIISDADKYLTEKSFTIGYYGGYSLTFNVPTDMPGKLANPPTYAGSDQYPYWTALSRQIEERLQTLSVAYLLTGKDEYAAKAIEWAEKMTEWKFWSDPYYASGNTCLDTAHITYGMCTVYDILYDKLSAELKEKIEDSLIEKSMKKLYTDIFQLSSDNGQMLRCAALMTACCTIFETNEELCSLHLTQARKFFNWYMDTMLKSGDHEGLMYTSYAVEYMVVALDHYSRAFGDLSMFEGDFLNKFLMEWIVVAAENAKGASPNIADCSNSTSYFFITASLVYKLTKNPLAAYYLVRNKISSSGLDALMYTCHDVTATPPDDSFLTKNLEVIGWGVFRTGWSASDPTMVFTSSPSRMGHCHYDANSFVLALNGAWLAKDPGYHSFDGGDESKYGSAGGHNTIYVDGKEQNGLGAGSISPKIDSRIVSYTVGEAANAYPGDLGITKMQRSFLQINHGITYYVLYDAINSSKEHVYTWRLNDEGYTAFNASENAFRVDYSGASLAVSFASPGALSINNTKYKSTSHSVVDVTGEKALNSEFLAVLTPFVPATGKIAFENLVAGAKTEGDDISVKSTAVDIFKTMFVKPGAYGNSVTVTVPVPASGKFDLVLRYINGKSYGSFDVYANGQLIGSVDSYNDDYVFSDTATFSDVSLNAGDLVLKFVWTDKTASPKADKMAFVSLEMKTDAEISQDVKVTETLTDDNIVGAVLGYAGSKSDVIAFSKRGKAISAANMESDGMFASVLGIDSGNIDGYAVNYGRSLTYGGKSLISSDKKITAAVDYAGGGITLESTTPTKITLAVPDGVEKVYLDGTGISVKDGYATFEISNGTFEATFSGAAPSEDPGENQDPGESQDPADGANNAWIIALICTAAVIVIAAVAVIAVKKNKK